MNKYTLKFAWQYYESNDMKLFLFYFKDRKSNTLKKGYVTEEWARALKLLLVDGMKEALDYLLEEFPQSDQNEITEELLRLYKQLRDLCP